MNVCKPVLGHVKNCSLAFMDMRMVMRMFLEPGASPIGFRRSREANNRIWFGIFCKNRFCCSNQPW